MMANQYFIAINVMFVTLVLKSIVFIVTSVLDAFKSTCMMIMCALRLIQQKSVPYV